MSETVFTTGAEDYAQAEWLTKQPGFDGRWRYDYSTKKWHHWDGKRWAPDKTEQVHRAVALAAARATARGENADITKKLLNTQPQDRALRALATLEGYGTDGSDWDQKPELLGVKNGVVDLRENKLLESPDPDCLVTKSTGVKFEPVADPSEFNDRAPRFMQALDEWMSGDPEMVAYLLLWFGSSMFGFSPEQRFLLMTGVGRNGKGALKHAIIKAVGEYGAQFDANLYMRSKFGAARSDSARADLMALKGKRITFFSEPEGNRFNEELLKAHTGGDKIVARALYSNEIQTWDPTHSITFLVNDPPEVDDLGTSMAARVMVADFRERFDGEKEDKTLYNALEREKEGILAILCWAAAAWHTNWQDSGVGITLPERVKEQSAAFMERNDPLAAFLDERCNIGAGLSVSGQELYSEYVEWFHESGHDGEAGSMVKFAQNLEKKGFRKQKTSTANKWQNLTIKSAMQRAMEEDDD